MGHSMRSSIGALYYCCLQGRLFLLKSGLVENSEISFIFNVWFSVDQPKKRLPAVSSCRDVGIPVPGSAVTCHPMC